MLHLTFIRALALTLALLLLPVQRVLAVLVEDAVDPQEPHRPDRARNDSVTTWLPKHLEPEQYRVRIRPILQEGNFSAPGELEFLFWARRPTDRIVLNVRDLRIDERSVVVQEEGTPGRWTSLPVLQHEYDGSLETYTVVVGASLRPGATRYRIRMKYVASVNDSLKGLYRVSYQDENNNKRWMAVTQLHPTNARTMFPCLDEPQYKARFTLSVGRRAEHVSLANMPLRASEPMDESGDWVWDHFETSVPMSSYLIALAVFDFAKIESGGGAKGAPSEANVLFRVWAKHADIQRGAYAAQIGPPLLDFFSRTFNISFPLPKQDMVASPKLMFGAMENWGLIFFRESALLVDEADPGSRHYVATTVAHELAHQWFGNLVTMRWWNDVWLNEGFATYMSQLGVSHVEPGWRSEGVFVLENMQIDALPSSHPVSREVYRVSDIDLIFDAISYKKGSSVVRMMSEILGAGAFQRGLNKYLRTHSYGNAAQDDLWAALTSAALAEDHAEPLAAQAGLPSGRTVKAIMDSWTLRSGFPLVTVERDYCLGTALVRQERFLVATAAAGLPAAPVVSAQAASSSSCCWGVPLWTRTARTASDTRSQSRRVSEALHWLESGNATLSGLPGSGHWLLVNGRRAGFYRVNYDATNWRLLTHDLAALSDLERAGLVDDALALAGAGHLDYDVGIGLLQRLPRDEPSLAWVAALTWLTKLTHLVHQPQGADPFSRWARALAVDLLRVAGPADHSTDPVDHTFASRARRWACALGVEGCLGLSASNATLRISDSDLCKALFAKADWNAEFTGYSGDEASRILRLAECVQSSVAATRMLEIALLEDDEGQRVVPLLKKLAANPYTFNVLMEFLKYHWKNLQERYGTAFIVDVVKEISPYSKSRHHVLQIRKMQDTTSQNIIPGTIEEGNHNIWWLSHQADKLQKAIERMYFLSNHP